jgi:uncharacterized membrane protein
VLRGLALVLPPVLTIVIFLWMAATVQNYLLRPVTSGARQVLVWSLSDVREEPTDIVSRKPTLIFDGRTYVRLDSGQYIPKAVTDEMRTNPNLPLPPTARAAYEQYVDARYLRPEFVIPIFLVVFVAVLYVLGKAFTLGLTRFFEPAILRLPLVRSVYSSVKKVTDFAFVENTVQYRRVVAIEFPRRGIWTIGLVTGEGMRDIAGAAAQPCVTVAVPGSPVPFTGNVVTVPKTEAYDLDITIDEALQFFISCGVVVPARELRGERSENRLEAKPTSTAIPSDVAPQ